MHGDPPRLEDVRPDAPAGLGSVIRRCLQKSVEDRYANVGELAMALVDFAPQRARSVAERAVSVTEAAGLMQVTGAPRPALDATLREPMMSPAPASARVPALRVITGGAARAGSSSARAAADAELAIAVTHIGPGPAGEGSRLLESRIDQEFAITTASPEPPITTASPEPVIESAAPAPAITKTGSDPAIAETGAPWGALVLVAVILSLLVGILGYFLRL
jgi:serine/threonine-protein kinase